MTNPKTIIIKADDTLSALARKFGTSVSALAQANNIKNVNMIFAGNSLKIPGAAAAVLSSVVTSAVTPVVNKARETVAQVTDYTKSLFTLLFGSDAKNVTLTSGYGNRLHPITHKEKEHTGIDVGAAAGTGIHAPADGTVVFAGVNGGYGNQVVLKHGDGIETSYSHLSKIPAGISRGAQVNRNDVIGPVGMTGDATGPHVHMEVKVEGKTVDPLKFQFTDALQRPAQTASRHAGIFPHLAPELAY